MPLDLVFNIFRKTGNILTNYLSMKPDDTNPLVELQAHLEFINSDKTEVIVLYPKNLRNMVSN